MYWFGWHDLGESYTNISLRLTDFTWETISRRSSTPPLKMTINLESWTDCKHHTGFDSLKVGLVVWSDSDMVECRTVTVRLCCLGLDPLDGSSCIEDKLYVLSSLSAVDRSRMVSRVFSLKVDSVRSRTPNHTPNRLLTWKAKSSYTL